MPKKQQKPPVSKSDDVDFSLNSESIASFALSVPNESDNEVSKSKDKPTSKGTLESKQKKDVKKENLPNPKLQRLPYRITTVPDGLPVVEYAVQPSKIVCFSGSSHFLSSFYKASFEFNGVRYLSVEHYYQATKLYALCGYETAAKLQFVREPFKAKQLAKEIVRRNRVPFQAIEAWKRSDGLVTLIYAVTLKFIQNPELREKLLKTGNALLVQTHAGDNFYASGMDQADFEKWTSEHNGQTLKLPYAINEYSLKHFPLMGNGQNILGVILMKVRTELATVTTADLYNRETVTRILMKLAN